jgi:hypothetical protein
MSGFSFSGHMSCMASIVGVCCLVFTGEVVQGVTCPAILTDDGMTIALDHLPSQFELGDRVTVTGSGYTPLASCQQQVLMVTQAEAAS